ncbi:MAG: hypothetical protein AAGU11_11295, partial [Syntrophobacteraceae bacterium]
ICFISHDRQFINAVANKVLLVRSGEIHLFPGNYEDYRNIWKHRLDGNGAEEASSARTADSGSNAKPKLTQKRIEAQLRNELFRIKKPVQDRIDALERQLDALHLELDLVKERLADPEMYKQGKLVQEVQGRFRELQASIRELTDEWEENALRLEEMEEQFRKERERQDFAV